MLEDARCFSPSAARNRDAIREALQPHLPVRGTVLEIASGSGEHIVHVAQAAGARATADPTGPDASSVSFFSRPLFPPTGDQLAGGCSDLRFQPTDPDPDARRSIDAWVSLLGLAHVLPSIALDAATAPWPVHRADLVLCINMIHIAPWQATIGLMAGAAAVLPPGGKLFLYGPFRLNGQHTSASNADFDADL